MRSPLRFLLVFALLLGAACFQSFNVQRFSSSGALYRAGMAQYDREKWTNAIDAFEKLTFDLPARDTLLPLAFWYLGHARRQNQERVLAAQAFIRLAEQFPADSLADDAIYWSARAYREMWRRPALDPQYGILAQAQFQTLEALFPDSRYADSTAQELRELDDWFAEKDFNTAQHYIRRRAYDSAIIYLRDIVAEHPNSDFARRSMLELVKIYRLPVMNYQADANEVCEALRAGFPTDADVLAVCKLPTTPGIPVPAGR